MSNRRPTRDAYVQPPADYPTGIVGVDTAVPCFVGYTATARGADGGDLTQVATPIASMDAFVARFGEPAGRYRLQPSAADGSDAIALADGVTAHLVATAHGFALHDSMRAYFANGGGACWVVSAGSCADVPMAEALLAGIAVTAALREPTMLAVPEAVLLPQADYAQVIAAMLQCCARAGDRMALLDVQELAATDGGTADVAAFRATLAGVPSTQWRYGAAYFPSLLIGDDPADLSCFDPAGLDALRHLLAQLAAATLPPPARAVADAMIARIGKGVARAEPADWGLPPDPDLVTHAQLTAQLRASLPAVEPLFAAIAAHRRTVPPSGAMAGIWCANDRARGVWNAPANLGIALALGPTLPIDEARQADLTAPPHGLAINAIRTFQTAGTLVWGARTLDSLSLDWRYIPIRRLVTFIEQSVRRGLQTLVFAPNTAVTWVTASAMISAFLHGIWQMGGLEGASAADAYAVQVGLGATMTPQDILDGRLLVSITLHVGGPGEWIELSFQQQLAVP